MGTGGNKRKTGSRREKLRRKLKRNLQRKLIFIGTWVPKSVAAAVDAALHASDLKRSEFLRLALEEKVRSRSDDEN